MTTSATLWDLAPHTKAKHDLLQRYLRAWFPILARHRGRVIFLDGFAGPGVYAGGEPGSPCLALEALLQHSFLPRMEHCEFLFIFNEKHAGRFQSLEASVADVVARHGGLPNNVKVTTVDQGFTDLADDLLKGLENKQLAPTFAFLDPFGYKDVPMSLIKDLLAYDKCELFIYFDHNSANRFSTSGGVDAAFEALYGTDEFKNAPPAGNPNRAKFLKDLYERQLSDYCGFTYVQSFQMINEGGRTGNYLFFCSRNIKGLSVMKDAMWKVDPSGGYKFSDLLDGQEVLFQDDVSTGPLRTALANTFKGQTVPIEDIEIYTVAGTPYITSHVRKTLKLMQQDGIISSPNQRKRGTFPSGTVVHFH